MVHVLLFENSTAMTTLKFIVQKILVLALLLLSLNSTIKAQAADRKLIPLKDAPAKKCHENITLFNAEPVVLENPTLPKTSKFFVRTDKNLVFVPAKELIASKSKILPAAIEYKGNSKMLSLESVNGANLKETEKEEEIPIEPWMDDLNMWK